jgi:hypothetical protein
MAADKMVVRNLFGEATDEPLPVVRRQSGSTIQGRYAEFMVCAYLARLGHNVIHVDATGFDLILEYEARSYRLDVKSTSGAYMGLRKQSVLWHLKKSHWIQGETAKRQRPMTPDDCDIVALFHTVFDTVVYYPITKPLNKVYLPLSQVRNSDYGAASLAAAVIAKTGGIGRNPGA